MLYPPKPQPGDRVAVLSPSNGNPSRFPHIYELGLARLRDELGLTAVEYPHTRIQATPAERADDLHAAYADPTVTAIMATIGGEDQITVLKHLDVDLIKTNPKPFFGYSDNTNLLNFLHFHGSVGYYGGSVMVHLGRFGRTHPDSMASLRAALFTSGWYDLAPASVWTDESHSWADPEMLAVEPDSFPGDGWIWHNADRVIEAPTWGGCVEIIPWILQAGQHVRPDADHDGGILLLESSEEMPPAGQIYRDLRAMGERGLLGRFAAVLVARPKAWERTRRNTPAQKQEYAQAQRAAILRALAAYAPDAMAVFDVDFGHTDPQLVLPYGGDIRIDGPNRTIAVRY
jgi:muramoyltetrapeptide carboxypeptidase LdcA involved in peptidoglycan recycling